MARFVLKFRKGEEVRWLGHLDLLRAFERIIRRAGVPVVYSQGFNPRAKMSFASALGVGVTGEQEILTIQMAGDIEPEEIARRMNAEMPDGILITEVERMPEGGPKTVQVSGSEFLVSMSREPGVTVKNLTEAVDKLLSREEITVEREKQGRKKKVNLRPSIESIKVVDECNLLMRLSHSGFTPKPSEIVEALAEYLPGLEIGRVHRVRIY